MEQESKYIAIYRARPRPCPPYRLISDLQSFAAYATSCDGKRVQRVWHRDKTALV